MDFVSTLLIILAIFYAIFFAIVWGKYFSAQQKTPTRTIRCPSCGAQAQVHGKTWECGWCGDCGTLR